MDLEGRVNIYVGAYDPVSSFSLPHPSSRLLQTPPAGVLVSRKSPPHWANSLRSIWTNPVLSVVLNTCQPSLFSGTSSARHG